MNSNNNHSRRQDGALVIGGDYQGLGIVRSLGRFGVPVGIIDNESSIARFSRYAAFAERVRSLSDPKDTIRTLMEIGNRRNLKGWVLYATRDETVAAISEHRDELSRIFRVTTPDWDCVRWIWDKRNTYKLAEKLQIPHPKTWYMGEVQDLSELEGHFPLALKPAIKEHFFYATKDKAWRVDNLDQLQRLLREASKLMPREEIILQDLIPGDGSNQVAYCTFFKDGKSIASVAACRKRQHPLDFGRASTYVESIDIPILGEYAERFLRAIDFYGLVEVEFKRDPRDGNYRLLDVNGRTWGYHTIGRKAGVDFPYLLYQDQMNQPVGCSKGKTGVKWIRTITDLPTGISGILSGKLDWRTYVRSLRSCDEDAVLSWEDPLPGLVEIALLPYLMIKRGF